MLLLAFTAPIARARVRSTAPAGTFFRVRLPPCTPGPFCERLGAFAASLDDFMATVRNFAFAALPTADRAVLDVSVLPWTAMAPLLPFVRPPPTVARFAAARAVAPFVVLVRARPDDWLLLTGWPFLAGATFRAPAPFEAAATRTGVFLGLPAAPRRGGAAFPFRTLPLTLLLRTRDEGIWTVRG